MWETQPDDADAAVPVLADSNVTVQAVPILRKRWTPLPPATAALHAQQAQHKAVLVQGIFSGQFPSPFAGEAAVPTASVPTAAVQTPVSVQTPASPAEHAQPLEPPTMAPLAAPGALGGRKRGNGADAVTPSSDLESVQAKRHRRHWLAEPLAPPAVPLDDRTLVYMIKTAGLPGKFDRDRAQALGVPRGPLYGRLVQGEAVVLPDGRTIQPSDCVGAPRPGPVRGPRVLSFSQARRGQGGGRGTLAAR